MDPRLDFELLSFAEMQAAPLSRRPLAGARLGKRLVVAKTNRGNIAKMELSTRNLELSVDRIIVYTFDSCVLAMAENIVLRGGQALDLDTARMVRRGGDLRWHAERGSTHRLEPLGETSLFAVPGVDELSVSDLRSLRFDEENIRTDLLPGHILYVRTRGGGIGRLAVDGGGDPRIRSLMMFADDGRPALRRSGIALSPGAKLDLDTGETTTALRHHLRHDVDAAGHGQLSAADGARFSPAPQYRMFKYAWLLNNDAIRAAMVFEDIRGALAYDEWSEARKTQLHEWLYMRETGQAFPLPGPPQLDADKTMPACSAWKIYLAHVVQSFWVDANQLVAWRLLDAGAEHLEHLLDSRRLLHFGEHGHKFASGVMGKVTAWSPFYCWDFLAANEFVRSSQWSTIKKVVEWARAHLIHIQGWENANDGPFESQEDQWEAYFGYRGPPPVNRMIDPLPGRKHITHGCWGTDGFLAAVLRAANIPVRHGRSELSNGNHSRPEFFTVGRNLVHGDDPYTAWIKLGVNNVPIHRIFRTNAEIEAETDAPDPLPGKSVGETAAYHHSRHMIALAVEYKTNYLLRIRCRDRSNGLNGPGSELDAAIGDYYTVAELAQIEADCDAALDAMPGGCFDVAE